MTNSKKDKIKQVLAEKKEMGDALYKELEAETSSDHTITIENLYSQLQSLKHEIDIEVIQQKLKTFDRLFKIIYENEDTLLKMLAWFKEKNK